MVFVGKIKGRKKRTWGIQEDDNVLTNSRCDADEKLYGVI